MTLKVVGSNPAFGTKLTTRKAYAWTERDITANFEGNTVQGRWHFAAAGL
jgi:hypothetical protein